MFNIQVKGSVRCNGITPGRTGGMAKRTLKAMSPNRGRTLTDTKLKFSDRLKAYLSTDGLVSDATELDDPYTFSDSEIKPLNSVKNIPRVKPEKHKLNHVNHVESVVNSGKTMSRLQAQIARNKVTVKHNNRLSPDLKVDKIHFDKNTKHSIIGLVNNVHKRRLPSGKPLPSHLRARRASVKCQQQQHEGSLQRIPTTLVPPAQNPAAKQRVWHAPGIYERDSEEGEEESCVYQRHWFNKDLELLSPSTAREVRLEMTLSELKRQLLQMKRSRVGHFRSLPSTSSYISSLSQFMGRRKSCRRRTNQRLVGSRNCEKDSCGRAALPCTKYCLMHIMDNKEQVLFEHCTAKFADNTQCSVPVFDIIHELPLCVEHARKRDNYNRMCLETKPKKPRRKIKQSAMIRPQKRSKKRKKPAPPPLPKNPASSPETAAAISSINEVTAELNICETSSAYESSEEIALGALSETEFVSIKGEEHNIGDQDVVEQVLAMQDEVAGDLELVVEQTLVTQASRLLEETDFTNVLNQIPADEFNDLFAVDRNGVYEPSREETEELERALEAVDEDVKSLEKLSQTQGLLDSLLDEHTLVESLVQIPDVFHHNGYEVQCIDSPGGLLQVQTQAHTTT